eukprot:scaffold10334_cov71-Phaeocystis_antarctica.AAC.2
MWPLVCSSSPVHARLRLAHASHPSSTLARDRSGGDPRRAAASRRRPSSRRTARAADQQTRAAHSGGWRRASPVRGDSERRARARGLSSSSAARIFPTVELGPYIYRSEGELIRILPLRLRAPLPRCTRYFISLSSIGYALTHPDVTQRLRRSEPDERPSLRRVPLPARWRYLQ